MSPYMNEEVNKLIAKHPARGVISVSDQVGKRAIRLLVLVELIEETAEKLWRKRGSLVNPEATLDRLVVLNAELTTCMVRYGPSAVSIAGIGSDWQEGVRREAEQEKQAKKGAVLPRGRAGAMALAEAKRKVRRG